MIIMSRLVAPMNKYSELPSHLVSHLWAYTSVLYQNCFTHSRLNFAKDAFVKGTVDGHRKNWSNEKLGLHLLLRMFIYIA